MDAMITPGFAISFVGGAVVCSILLQYLKNALHDYICNPKALELAKFLELVVVSGIVAFVWQQAIEKTGALNDQLTFGVRWLFYMATSHFVYRWFIKKVMPDLGAPRTKAAKDPE
jgi:glycerol uptake facilitator-like aquaporin